MATGLRTPVGVNIDGGAALVSDRRQLIDLLKLALSPGEDDNPFQNLGLEEDIIFKINDPGATALQRSRVRRILSKFADRVAIDPSVPIQFFQNKEEELAMQVGVIDLEVNEPFDFVVVVG